MAMSRIPGIDISVWDEGIDLNAWKAKHGIGAVIVKCGGNEGGRYVDRCFADHMRKAQAAGLPAGVYFYTTSTTITAALGDADYCVSLIRGYDLQLPVFMDVEDNRQFALSPRALTDVIMAFCGRVQEHGYRAGLYTGGYAFNNNMYADELRQYCTWIASWQETWPNYVGKIDMWQQGTKRLSDGHVYYDDVSGCQDFDWCEDYVIQGGGGDVTRKLIDPANEAAEIHAFMCTDPRFGYSQDPRWGGDYNGGEVATFTSKAGYTYRILCGSYDCSSSTTLAWRLALSRTKHAGCLGDDPYERTASMRATFCGTGLFTASLSNAKRGDLYLNEGVHVAMCQDGSPDHDILSEFNRNEHHGATGGRAGDQDGGESVIRGYYNDDWNTVLHYVGGMLEDVTAPTDEPEKEETMTAFFVKFDGDPTEHFCEDGIHLHAIANGDEKKAIIDFWKLGHPGQTLDPNPKTFGTKDAPWGARYNDVMSRGANFAGFERFNKHPSTRAVMRDENARQTDEILKGLEAALS